MKINEPTKPIAICCGEPAGIGPDIILQTYLQQPKILENCHIIGNKKVLEQRANELNMEFVINQNAFLKLTNIEVAQSVESGRLNQANSHYVIECINRATQGCLDHDYHAMVTAPVHKGIINDAGVVFSGHTEWIAALCKVETPVMMLANENFRVCLATTHIPLAKVAQSINATTLTQILITMHQELRSKFDISQPKIGICGLNPHAGENGHLGDEELRIMNPAIEKLRSRGLNLSNPLPADTLFIEKNRKQYDAILAMYHDQGLPVIKQAGFGSTVNITLGLPIIRTSVDHGTAIDLAGTGKADPSSLIAAIKQAKKLHRT